MAAPAPSGPGAGVAQPGPGGAGPGVGPAAAAAAAGGGTGGRIEIGIMFHELSRERVVQLASENTVPGAGGTAVPNSEVNRSIPVQPNTPLAKVFRAFARDQRLPNPEDWRMLYLAASPTARYNGHLVTSLTVKVGQLGVQSGDRFAVVWKDDSAEFPPMRLANRAGQSSGSANTSPALGSASGIHQSPGHAGTHEQTALPGPRLQPPRRPDTPPAADSSAHVAPLAPEPAPAQQSSDHAPASSQATGGATLPPEVAPSTVQAPTPQASTVQAASSETAAPTAEDTPTLSAAASIQAHSESNWIARAGTAAAAAAPQPPPAPPAKDNVDDTPQVEDAAGRCSTSEQQEEQLDAEPTGQGSSNQIPSDHLPAEAVIQTAPPVPTEADVEPSSEPSAGTQATPPPPPSPPAESADTNGKASAVTAAGDPASTDANAAEDTLREPAAEISTVSSQPAAPPAQAGEPATEHDASTPPDKVLEQLSSNPATDMPDAQMTDATIDDAPASRNETAPDAVSEDISAASRSLPVITTTTASIGVDVDAPTALDAVMSQPTPVNTAGTAGPPPLSSNFESMIDSMFQDGSGGESWQHALAGFGESSAATNNSMVASTEDGGPRAADVSMEPAEARTGDVPMTTTSSGTAAIAADTHTPLDSGAVESTQAESRPAAAARQTTPGPAPSSLAAKSSAAPTITLAEVAPQKVAQASVSIHAPASTTAGGAPPTSSGSQDTTLGGEGVDIMRKMLAKTTQKMSAPTSLGFSRFKKPSTVGTAAAASSAAEGPSKANLTKSTESAAISSADSLEKAKAAGMGAAPSAPAALARDFFADELDSSSQPHGEDEQPAEQHETPLRLGTSTALETQGHSTPSLQGSMRDSPASTASGSKVRKAGPTSKMGGFKPRPKSKGGDGSTAPKHMALNESGSESAVASPISSALELPASRVQRSAVDERQETPQNFQHQHPDLQRTAELIRIKQERLAEAEREQMLLTQAYDGNPGDDFVSNQNPAPPMGSQARLLHNPRDLLPRSAPPGSATPEREDQAEYQRSIKGSPHDGGLPGKHYTKPKRYWEGEDEHGRRSRSPIEMRKHPPEVRKQMTREQRELNELIDGPIDRLPEEGPQARPRPRYTHDWSSGSGQDTDEDDSADEQTLRRREEMLAAKGVAVRPHKQKRRKTATGSQQPAATAVEEAASGSASGSRRAASRDGTRSAGAQHARDPSLPNSVPPPAAARASSGKAGTSAHKAAAEGKDARVWPDEAKEAEAEAAQEIEDIINRHEYLKLHPNESKHVRSGIRKSLYDECPKVPKEFIDWREQYALEDADELDQHIGDLLGGNLWHGDKIADRFHFKATSSQVKLARMLVILEVCLQTRASLAGLLRNRGKGGGRRNLGVAPGKWPITLEHIVDKVMKYRKNTDLTTRDLDDILAEAVALRRRVVLDGAPDRELEEKLALSSSQIVVEPPKATTLQQPPTPPGGWPPKKKKSGQQQHAAPSHVQPSAGPSTKRGSTHDSATARSRSPSVSGRTRIPTSKAKASADIAASVLNHNAELKRKRHSGRAVAHDDEEEDRGSHAGQSDNERPVARLKTEKGGVASNSKKGKAPVRPSHFPAGDLGHAVSGSSRSATGQAGSSSLLSPAVLQQFEDVFDDKLERAFPLAFDEQFSSAFGKAWKPALEMGFGELFPKAAREYWATRQKDMAASLRRQLRAEIQAELESTLQAQRETIKADTQAEFAATLASTLESYRADMDRKQLAREKANRRAMKEEMLIELGKELRAQLRSHGIGGVNSSSASANGSAQGVPSSSTSAAMSPSPSNMAAAGVGTGTEDESGTHSAAAAEAAAETIAESQQENVPATPVKAPYKQRKIRKSAPSRKAAAASGAGPSHGETSATGASHRNDDNEDENGRADDNPSGSAATASVRRTIAPVRSPGGNSGSRVEIVLPLRPRLGQQGREAVVQQSSDDEDETNRDDDGVGGASSNGLAASSSSASLSSGGRRHAEAQDSRIRDAASALVGAMHDVDDASSVAVDRAVDAAFGLRSSMDLDADVAPGPGAAEDEEMVAAGGKGPEDADRQQGENAEAQEQDADEDDAQRREERAVSEVF